MTGLWKYAADDYLEITGHLGPRERRLILENLAGGDLEIRPCTAFMAGNTLVAVCGKTPDNIRLFDSKGNLLPVRTPTGVRNH